MSAKPYNVDQVIFAPFGDDPVLISAVTITNHGTKKRTCAGSNIGAARTHQFSFRSWMQANVVGTANTPALRREFADRFSHEFRELPNRAGLIESQKFHGRSAKDLARWEEVQAALKKNPAGFYGGSVPDSGARGHGRSESAAYIFGFARRAGGRHRDRCRRFSALAAPIAPAGICATNSIATSDANGPASALLLERRLKLQPQESRTIYFMYGYLPEDLRPKNLVAKYSADPAKLCASSSAWKT